MSEPTLEADLDDAHAPSPKVGFWLRELPYLIVLLLAVLGVAYTSFSRKPLVTYWEFLAILIAITCVVTGWLNFDERRARVRLLWTQALHWMAFLFAMNLVLLPGVQRMLNSEATGLTLLMLLALGTFISGVHIASWQICFIGFVMAIGVPGIAWLDQSALIVVLALITVVAIGATVMWWRRGGGRHKVVHDVRTPDAVL
jgi:hypothetical protein